MAGSTADRASHTSADAMQWHAMVAQHSDQRGDVMAASQINQSSVAVSRLRPLRRERCGGARFLCFCCIAPRRRHRITDSRIRARMRPRCSERSRKPPCRPVPARARGPPTCASFSCNSKARHDRLRAPSNHVLVARSGWTAAARGGQQNGSVRYSQIPRYDVCTAVWRNPAGARCEC